MLVPAAAAPLPPPRRVDPFDAPGRRILIAEDEPLLAASLRDWLEAAGYAVCGIAADGPAAVRLAQDHEPDLAIVDVTLAGGSDGIATAWELDQRLKTPTLFLTAHVDAIDQSRVGAACLAKPATERDVVASVETVLALAANTLPTSPPPHRLRVHRPAPTKKRAVAPLAEGESRYRAVFETAPHGIALVNLEFAVVDANVALTRILGLPLAQVVATRLQELPFVDAAVLAGLRACVAGADDTLAARDVVGDAGSAGPRHYVVSASLVRGAGGEPHYFVVHVADRTEQRTAEAALRRLAWRDHLTGLANRAAFDVRLDQARARAARGEDALAVLLVDLDGFKQANDTYGHGGGDALLRELARRLKERLREGDTVARLGGDEFAVVLPGATAAGAERLAVELGELIRRPVALAQGAARVDACVGVAWSARGDRSAAALLERADAALYRAKRRGRGVVILDGAGDEGDRRRRCGVGGDQPPD